MDSIPSIPLICASIISVILVSTIFDAAPGYMVSIEISDLSMSGNCLRGILLSERSPINIMKLIKTVQKTGFLIKILIYSFNFHWCSFFDFVYSLINNQIKGI